MPGATRNDPDGIPQIRERDIEDYLKRRVKAMGGEVRKVKWIGRRHAPDRLVLLPRGHFFVELKAPGVKPEPGQLREHDRLRLAGFVVRVIDSFSEVDWVLR